MRHDCARGGGVPLPSRLLRLHRHSRANLLVTGGTRALRLGVARAFHDRSPQTAEPFTVVDCRREEAQLVRVLERWLLATPASDSEPGESRDGGGVLYLDPVSALSPSAQRLLLMLAHRLQGCAATVRPPGPTRLMAGDRLDPARAADSGGFSGALADHLDKIRVDIGRRPARGAA